MCERRGSFSTEGLNRLAAILERRRPGFSVARHVLDRQLLDLIIAVGRADDGSEAAAWFREAGKNEPSNADLAAQFRQIAEAEDPLNPNICHGLALTALNAAARRRWTSRQRQRPMNRPDPLRDITSDFLSTDEIAEVREMALHLATYHQSFIRSGRSKDQDQDTLLEGIAEIFIRFADLRCHPHALPHAANSSFVRFAYLAMRPFFAQTEASKSAIAKRWKRLKDHALSVP
jgi:hypothetical protein